MSELNLEYVRHALELARKNGFAEVEVSTGEVSFTATLSPAAKRPTAAAAGTPGSEASAEPERLPIKSTIVGYYREANPPLAVGQTIARGDVVAVIAALGLANDIESTVAGEVVEVLVQPEQPVEYGQPLAFVRPQ